MLFKTEQTFCHGTKTWKKKKKVLEAAEGTLFNLILYA